VEERGLSVVGTPGELKKRGVFGTVGAWGIEGAFVFGGIREPQLGAEVFGLLPGDAPGKPPDCGLGDDVPPSGCEFVFCGEAGGDVVRPKVPD